MSFGRLRIKFSYKTVPGSSPSRIAIAAHWGSQLTYLISALNLLKKAHIVSRGCCLVLNKAAISFFYFRLQKYCEMKMRLNVSKFAIDWGLRSWNHVDAGPVRLEGKSLQINFSSVVSTDICCLYPLM